MPAMKDFPVYIASDHAGFPRKALAIEKLATLGFQIEDLGPQNDERVDYPDYADLLAHKLITHPESLGLLICGSGQGMAMRANKYPHIRAGLCWSSESAELSRQHNNANVLCLGARLLAEDVFLQCIESFFSTEFEGGRHQNRVDKLSRGLNES